MRLFKSDSNPSRREFLTRCGAAGSAIALSAISYSRVLGAGERLRVASVGTGGKGWSDLQGVAASPSVDVVALCDIDSSAEHLGRAAEQFPQARRFADWRRLLDDAGNVDGVIVSTPDFMHAPISLPAMQLGKHVFCQKPLTHSVHEARQMRLAAARNKVVTQMGNQIQSHAAYRTAVSWIRAGEIGLVKSVHSWQGGTPAWPRAIERPTGSDPVPEHVQWDLWQGVAAERPFLREFYHPFNWRGWQDYGTGQLGDFGCHILDPVFKSLDLTAPTQLTAQAPPLKPETWTDAATVHYEFPGTAFTAEKTLPLTWYDAIGITPPREKLEHVPTDYSLPNAGSVLIGERGSVVIPHVAMPRLFAAGGESREQPAGLESVDHYVQWADACRGSDQTTSHFDYSGPLTEAVLLGTIAIRFPGTTLQWNSDQLAIVNSSEANRFVSKAYRKGWEPSWIS